MCGDSTESGHFYMGWAISRDSSMNTESYIISMHQKYLPIISPKDNKILVESFTTARLKMKTNKIKNKKEMFQNTK